MAKMALNDLFQRCRRRGASLLFEKPQNFGQCMPVCNYSRTEGDIW